ncbi:hypothetical protein AMECASPLE_002084 [Ameca splendens]|uniref:Uncharacterized protein n=1 Tax=Ameca splendens TaxID=208324 RepID=A0ABV0YWQ1_9TELE
MILWCPPSGKRRSCQPPPAFFTRSFHLRLPWNRALSLADSTPPPHDNKKMVEDRGNKKQAHQSRLPWRCPPEASLSL